MQPAADKRELVKMLQAKINAMQGLGKSPSETVKSFLTPFDAAFPAGIFPLGALHEFVSYEPVEAASANGLITALTGKIMGNGGLCLWISGERKIYPSGLKHFGLEPDRVIFINASKPKDRLWIIEEALKCEAVTIVIGELKELTFTESRRLQLAVERSGVTAFIHRHNPRFENAVACTARWKVTPLAGIMLDDLPGVGYSCWDIQLLKVKNGKPEAWQIGWIDKQFTTATHKQKAIPLLTQRNTA